MMLVMQKWVLAGLAAAVILGPSHLEVEDHQEQFEILAVLAILAACVFAVIIGGVAALLLLLTVGFGE